MRLLYKKPRRYTEEHGVFFSFVFPRALRAYAPLCDTFPLKRRLAPKQNASACSIVYMNNIPKLFIETTVFNFYLEGKQGKKQKDAMRLFEEIAKGKYEAYSSEEVLRELQKTTTDKYEQMLSLYGQYVKKTIAITAEADLIAKIYISKGIIPRKYLEDALHIAMATVNNLDFVISFNQGHIVKTKTMIGTGLVNLRQGFRQICLATPTEVLEYDC